MNITLHGRKATDAIKLKLIFGISIMIPGAKSVTAENVIL